MPRGRAGEAAGKLKAVARAWAGGRGGKVERADDVVTQNAILPKWMERDAVEAAAIEIPADDAAAVGLFMALDTQWRHHAMTGQRLGIDYAAIRPTAELVDIAVTPQVMADLRVMEIAALNELAKARRP